jgi:hypothetical protein
MIAQAIEGVMHSPMNMFHNNQTSSNQSHTVIMNERISIATTLALLVGLVQVMFNS